MARRGSRLPKAVRITAALDPDTAKIFQQMADVSGVSLSRTIGSWCAQTADGARVCIDMLSKAKDAPRFVMREFHGRAQAVQQHIDEPAASPARPARPVLAGRRVVEFGGGSAPRPVTRGDSVTTSSHGGQSRGKP